MDAHLVALNRADGSVVWDKKSRITFHFVKDYPYRDRTCPAVQVLFRLGGTGFRERTFFLGF